MRDYDTTGAMIRLRHQLRELLTAGDYEPASDVIEHLSALATDGANDEVGGECERWRLRFALAAAA